MLTTLIFSKNRACQLNLLLKSIQQNLPNFDLEDVCVLYTATTSRFFAGYEILEDSFPEVNFILQYDFEENTRAILHDANEYVCFFVDDNIIYRQSSLSPVMVSDFMSKVPVCCISLRLGTNTTIQDQYHQVPAILPRTFFREGEFLVWDWSNCPPHGNFGYPFSVDGHIYKTTTVMDGLTFDFDTPNAFEGRYDVKHFENFMACIEHSILVNNPLNLVGSSNNNAGKFYGHTLEELNNKFLNYYTIDLNSIMETNVIGCHQEIPMEFIKDV